MSTTGWKTIARAAGPLLAGGLALTAGLARSGPVKADAADEAAGAHERCATRLSIALLGTSASTELLASPDPQSQVDTMLGDPKVIDRFARYVNAQFNADPGKNAAEDASYVLAKYVMTNGKPWKEMFVGAYDVTNAVADDPNGLGYFRSDAWMKRYAGNEEAGYRIVAGYRILQNTTGLALTATTKVDGMDLSANGRQNPACAGCHFQNWYALDKVARVLSRRQGMDAKITFTPPTDGPQEIIGGVTVSNDKELVEAIVATEAFTTNACRIAFRFLYGRTESKCEGKVFDACVDAFKASGAMKDALATIAKDPTFCQ